ncbi:hypothetical protein [Spirochaeta lutea]|uniref:Uncharacterized protein n=1 Tax=Spirochaeta lutea TaxID=1480694 RepID=A0A098QX37_9SPIO|nr:hypothetical protein [Spirochaeta lutea]KGE71973.1 hypothetical protein DC28_09280 [Spirochaeta lutea]
MNLPKPIWILLGIWETLRILLLWYVVLTANLIYGTLSPVVLAVFAAPQAGLLAGAFFYGLVPTSSRQESRSTSRTGRHFFPIFIIGKLATTASLAVLVLLWVQGLRTGTVVPDSESALFLFRSLGLLGFDLIILVALPLAASRGRTEPQANR